MSSHYGWLGVVRPTTPSATRRERELESTNDELTREVEELRQERRERGERDAAAAEARRRGFHPSNRLSSGDVTNPREALELYRRALERERAECARIAAQCPPDPHDPHDVALHAQISDDEFWAREVETAQAMLAEYDAVVGAAMRALAEQWTAEGEESIRHAAGLALTDGDWSRIAI
jgi:hypothetical protein